MKNQKNNYFLILLLLLISCSHNGKKRKTESVFTDVDTYTYHQKIKVRCTKGEQIVIYEIGDLPCTRSTIEVKKDEKLIIYFKVLDKNSDDPYKRGYQELLRVRKGKVIEKLKMRTNDDAHWSEVPFVRIREKKYLADLDNDGYLEFAVFPFHPGSAIWGTVRIFSLKEKITFWGEGRYQFEGDTFVQLGCPACSKFNPENCRKCY